MKNNPNITKSKLHLLNFKRLFWRIFICFWLASLAIMAATTYVVIGEFETSKLMDKHRASLLNKANNIILKYEEGLLPHRKSLKEDFHKNSHRSLASPTLINIFDENKKLIFGHRSPRIKNNSTIHIQVNSPNGNRYEAYSISPRAPKFFRKALQRFNSVQFIFIFILATLTSIILSWSISRPLKKLGDFSRQYAQGRNQTVLDPKLLLRGDEVGNLACDIDYMTKKINSTLNAQQQLLHDVSHELRAPLSRLQASTALIEQQEKNNAFTTSIHSECQHISQLIQQILNYSRLNKTDVTLETIDLVQLTGNICQHLKNEYSDKAFNLSHSHDAITIIGHALSVNSALENILTNACKHTPPNTKIDIEILLTEGQVLINVHDNGEGVAPEDIEKLQQPFYRAGNEMHTEGFGLGLSIAKKAIINNGGELTIKNHPDGGLLVQCKLPHAT